jgi:colicin import membrane protein
MTKAKKTKQITAGLLLFSTLFACQAHVQRQPEVQKEKEPEIVVNVSPQIDPIQIGRTTFDLHVGERIGSYRRSAKCAPKGRSLQWQRGRMWNLGRVRLDQINFKENLGHALRNQEYDVIYSKNKASNYEMTKGFEVEAKIQKIKMDICDAYNPYQDEMLGIQYGTAEVNMLWTVISKKDGYPIYEAETTALVTLEEGQENGETEMFRRALNNNIETFAADSDLFTALNGGVSYEEFMNSEYVKAKQRAEAGRIAAEKAAKEAENRRIMEERAKLELQRKQTAEAIKQADLQKQQVENEIKIAQQKREAAEKAAMEAEAKLKAEQEKNKQVIAELRAEQEKIKNEKEELEKEKVIAEKELQKAQIAVDVAVAKRKSEEEAITAAIEKQSAAETAAKQAADKSKQAEIAKKEAEDAVKRAKQAVADAEKKADEVISEAKKQIAKAKDIKAREAKLKDISKEKDDMASALLSAERIKEEAEKAAKQAAIEKAEAEKVMAEAVVKRKEAEIALKKAEKLVAKAEKKAQKAKTNKVAVASKKAAKKSSNHIMEASSYKPQKAEVKKELSKVKIVSDIERNAEEIIAKNASRFVSENQMEKTSKVINATTKTKVASNTKLKAEVKSAPVEKSVQKIEENKVKPKPKAKPKAVKAKKAVAQTAKQKAVKPAVSMDEVINFDVRSFYPVNMAGAIKFEHPINRNLNRIHNGMVKVVVGNSFQYGFFISPTYIITNKFFINRQMNVDIELAHGQSIPGTIVRKHPDFDVAMIEVEDVGYISLPVSFGDISMDQAVYTVGYEKAQFENVLKTKNRLKSVLGTVLEDAKNGRVKVKINGGNSRSPLFDDKGNIIAIPDIKTIGYDSVEYITIDKALDVIKVHNSNGYR